MPKKTIKLREKSATGQAVKILLEFCLKEKIENPMLVATIDVSDGSKYKLIFERVDLEENVPLKNRE